MDDGWFDFWLAVSKEGTEQVAELTPCPATFQEIDADEIESWMGRIEAAVLKVHTMISKIPPGGALKQIRKLKRKHAKWMRMANKLMTKTQMQMKTLTKLRRAWKKKWQIAQKKNVGD